MSMPIETEIFPPFLGSGGTTPGGTEQGFFQLEKYEDSL